MEKKVRRLNGAYVVPVVGSVKQMPVSECTHTLSADTGDAG
jgi:hypothetical protein